jgi:hypothetical protein
MTASEMINNFLVEYDRVFSLSAPSYTNSEILFFLNKAQTDLTHEIYKNGDTYLLNGSSLVTSHSFASPAASTNYAGNAYALTLTTATRYKYYLKSFTALTRDDFPEITVAERFMNTDIPKDAAILYEASTANNNIFRNPKAFIDGETLVVLVDSYSTPTSVYVEYIKEPKTLATTITDGATQTSTSELRADLHNEIVTKAVLFSKSVTNVQEAAASLQIERNV